MFPAHLCQRSRCGVGHSAVRDEPNATYGFGLFSPRRRAVHGLRPMKQFATITVIGRDKTGVIARVTSYLFEQKANIEALEEQVTRGQFSMAIQASWKPGHLSVEAVRGGLDRLAKALGMEIKLRFTEPHRRQRMAIMASREPHCLEGLLASV